MIKDIIAANETVKPNRNEMEILHTHFPQCFNADGEFDIDKFQELIKDSVGIAHEGYDLNFLGKSYAKLLASIDTTTVIIPDEEHNSKPENINSKNIYISGDNLDGLKHLLKSYSGKVKCIYIDPPYNTGSDGFVYNDNFNFTSEELQTKLSISEEQANKILDLTKRGSASHSAWLMFMASRLQLAKDLLTNDGVIFISIDDNEQANLKLLCDSIFGEENFWASIPRITKKSGKSSDVIALNHDYVLVYTNSRTPKLYALSHNDSGYKYKDEYFEQRGYYKLNQTLDYDSLQYSSSLDYPIEIDGEIFYAGSSEDDYNERHSGNHDRADWCWRWSKDKFNFGLENGFIQVKRSRNGSRIYTKTYQQASIEDGDVGYIIEYGDRTKGLSTLEFTENTYSNDNATKDIAKTVGKKIFDYTKPISLISTILDLSVRDNDIVLDFFSGSATTAEAVMTWNETTRNSVQYILIQLPEKIKETTAAYRNGYKTIDEIGRDRIIKAAEIIKENNSEVEIDYGFKHYTLAEPTEDILNRMESFDPTAIFDDNTILKEFGASSVLETWKVRDGYGFGAQSEALTLDKYTAHYIDKHLYLVDSGFTENDMVALIDKYNNDEEFNPEQIVVFGYSFTFSTIEMLKSNLATLREGAKNLKVNIDIRY